MLENRNWYIGAAVVGLMLYSFNSFLDGLTFRSNKNDRLAEQRLNRLLNDRGNKLSNTGTVIKDRVLTPPSTPELPASALTGTTMVQDRAATLGGAVKPTTPAATDKKKDDKKKQNKKKKKPKSVATAPARKPMTMAEKSPRRPEGFGAGVLAPVATNNANGDPNSKNEKPSVEEWVRRLLYPPSYEETTKFIHEFQSGHLDAATYYTLIDKMIEDNNREAREFGIMALASVPRLESFIRLATLTKTERSQALLEKIEYGLKIYQNPEHFHLLTEAIRSSEEMVVRFEAAFLIHQTARQYEGGLQTTEGPGRGGQRGGVIRTAGSRTLASLGAFSQTDRFLQEYMSQERDGTVLGQIQTALEAVRLVLSKSRVAAGNPAE